MRALPSAISGTDAAAAARHGILLFIDSSTRCHATENKALGVPAAKVAPAVMDAAMSFPSGDKKYSSFPSARHLGWDSSAC
jgi:hypothetical protein